MKLPRLTKKIDTHLYLSGGYARTRPQAEQLRRELLAGFSTKLIIPEDMPTQTIAHKSSIDVHITPHHTTKGYSLWWKPKKKLMLPHPTWMQHHRRKP